MAIASIPCDSDLIGLGRDPGKSVFFLIFKIDFRKRERERETERQREREKERERCFWYVP